MTRCGGGVRRETDELGKRFCANFLHRSGAMVLDRALTGAKNGSDFLVGLSLDHQIHNKTRRPTEVPLPGALALTICRGPGRKFDRATSLRYEA
jgi:hypothetical protein